MMNRELKDIIYSTKRERIFTDGTTIGGIICPLIKINQWDVYIYGGRGRHQLCCYVFF